MQAILIPEIVSQLRQRRNGRTFIAEFINQCEWVDTIPLDKVKKAREEMNTLPKDYEYALGVNACLEILDRLIESEEK